MYSKMKHTNFSLPVENLPEPIFSPSCNCSYGMSHSFIEIEFSLRADHGSSTEVLDSWLSHLIAVPADPDDPEVPEPLKIVEILKKMP